MTPGTIEDTSAPASSLSLEERLRMWPATGAQGDAFSATYVARLMGEAADALRSSTLTTDTSRAAAVEETLMRTALLEAKQILEHEDWWHDPSAADYPSRFVIERALTAPAAATEGQWEPLLRELVEAYGAMRDREPGGDRKPVIERFSAAYQKAAKAVRSPPPAQGGR